MSAIDLIRSFAEFATVTRFGPGAYVDGEYEAGVASTFEIEISLQPLSGTELLNQPEAQRTKRLMKGYTARLLQTTDEINLIKADQLVYNNTIFEVQKVERWRGDLNFYKVLLVEENL